MRDTDIGSQMGICVTHVPTPGDHYSPSTGSSYASVIYELAKQHDLAGGLSRVVVGIGTQIGYPPYDVGECVEVPFGRYPERKTRLVDAICGAIGGPRPFKWAAYKAMLAAIPPEYADWIFVHGEPAIISYLRRYRPRARLLLYCHYDLFRWYTSHEVRRILKKTDKVVCISEFIRDYLFRKAACKPANVIVAYNGVDLDTFQRPTPSTGAAGSLIVDVQPPTVLFVGRMCEDKGPHLLLEAAVLLRRQGVQFRLRLVGSQYLGAGSPMSGYELQLRSLAEPIADVVEFVPFVSRREIASVYQAAAVFCIPSTWAEPFGLTLVEGMAAGCAVVASRRGALPEIAGDAAVYFDPPDVAELADQLGRLLIDVVRREDFGRRARDRAERFTWADAYRQLSI
jgi:glycosyltransferase involved in cell wall biosynthesis